MRDWELDGIAAALEDTMPDLCDVWRRSGNTDEYGGGPELVRVLQSVKVGVAPTDFFQYQEPRAGGREADLSYYSLAFPRGTVVREGDTIDIITLGTKITISQVERAETWDTMLRCYGQLIEDDDWFHLQIHLGGHLS